jgi:hypothetical protein
MKIVIRALPSKVLALIAEINRRATSDETLADVLAIGNGLVELFGYNKIPGLIRLNKKSYPSRGLKPGYSWVRRLMKISMDPKIADEQNWEHLPSARTSLFEIALMKEERFRGGTHSDPTNNGVIVITPATSREDLKMYRIADEPIKPRPPDRYVMLAIPPRENWEGAIDGVRERAFAAGCHFVIAEVLSRKKKELCFSTDSHEETHWALRQVGKVETQHRG